MHHSITRTFESVTLLSAGEVMDIWRKGPSVEVEMPIWWWTQTLGCRGCTVQTIGITGNIDWNGRDPRDVCGVRPVFILKEMPGTIMSRGDTLYVGGVPCMMLDEKRALADVIVCQMPFSISGKNNFDHSELFEYVNSKDFRELVEKFQPTH